MNVLSENQLDKMPADARVWMLLDAGHSGIYLRVPVPSINGYYVEIVGFLEQEDAARMVNLLKTNAAYQHQNIEIAAESLTEVRNGARLYDEEISVLNHALALELFDVYPKLLSGYQE